MDHAVPAGMRNRDERAGRLRPHGERDIGFIGRKGREIERQADRQQVPDDAVLQALDVHLGAEQGREVTRPESRWYW